MKFLRGKMGMLTILLLIIMKGTDGPPVRILPNTGPPVRILPNTGPPVRILPNTGPPVRILPNTGPPVRILPNTGSTVRILPNTGPPVRILPYTGPPVRILPNTGPPVRILPNTGPTMTIKACVGENKQLMTKDESAQEDIITSQWIFRKGIASSTIDDVILCKKETSGMFMMNPLYSSKVEQCNTMSILLKNISFHEEGYYILQFLKEKIGSTESLPIFLTVSDTPAKQCKPVIRSYSGNMLHCSTQCEQFDVEWRLNKGGDVVGNESILPVDCLWKNESILCCLKSKDTECYEGDRFDLCAQITPSYCTENRPGENVHDVHADKGCNGRCLCQMPDSNVKAKKYATQNGSVICITMVAIPVDSFILADVVYASKNGSVIQITMDTTPVDSFLLAAPDNPGSDMLGLLALLALLIILGITVIYVLHRKMILSFPTMCQDTCKSIPGRSVSTQESHADLNDVQVAEETVPMLTNDQKPHADDNDVQVPEETVPMLTNDQKPHADDNDVQVPGEGKILSGNVCHTVPIETPSPILGTVQELDADVKLDQMKEKTFPILDADDQQVQLQEIASPMSDVGQALDADVQHIQEQDPLHEAEEAGTEHQPNSETTREIQELRHAAMCKICFVRRLSVLFMPCNHMATCDNCSSALGKCPICRAIIDVKIKSIRYE